MLNPMPCPRGNRRQHTKQRRRQKTPPPESPNDARSRSTDSLRAQEMASLVDRRGIPQNDHVRRASSAQPMPAPQAKP
jgi:hypothetical protein